MTRACSEDAGLATRASHDKLRGMARADLDRIADVRDGLTRIERVVLFELHKAQQEGGGRNVPSALLYGRVVEHVNISVEEFQRTLQRLVGR
jgi:hypothetical protein